MVQYYPHKDIDENDLDTVLRIREGARIIMGLGPCRVGTKAQLHTLAASGYPAYEQPVKSAFRCLGHRLEPEPVHFEAEITYIKETIGPYTVKESEFDPLEIFCRARGNAWARENLKLVFLTRNPLDTWISWFDQWGDMLEPSRLFEHFQRSFRTTRRILERSRSLGITRYGFDYERNRKPSESYHRLFEELGLERDPVISGWNDVSVRERIEAKLKLFREPEVFLPEGIRETIRASDGLHYQTYEESSVPIPGDLDPVWEDYEAVRTSTQKV